MAELCLPCHGPADRIDPAAQALLDEHYADDQTPGLEPGQFRGVICVPVPID